MEQESVEQLLAPRYCWLRARTSRRFSVVRIWLADKPMRMERKAWKTRLEDCKGAHMLRLERAHDDGVDAEAGPCCFPPAFANTSQSLSEAACQGLRQRYAPLGACATEGFDAKRAKTASSFR